MKRRLAHAAVTVIAVTAVVLGLMLAIDNSWAKASRNLNPGVLPTQSHAHGKTYGEWAAEWWKWALFFPWDENPVADPTGEDAWRGQSGSVWFLAGTFGGYAERTCTVPPGKALFFPIANTVWWAPEDGDTEEELRDIANSSMDEVTELECTVDGVELKDLFSYRADSPAFSFPLLFGGPGRDLAVADGYWVMLAPLPTGEHIIHFRAAKGEGWEVEVLYYLTVGK